MAFTLLKLAFEFANEKPSLEFDTEFPLRKIPSFYLATSEMKEPKEYS